MSYFCTVTRLAAIGNDVRLMDSKNYVLSLATFTIQFWCPTVASHKVTDHFVKDVIKYSKLPYWTFFTQTQSRTVITVDK